MTSETEADCIKAILYLKPLDKIRVNSPTYLQGSVIAQHMLRFEKEVCSKIMASLISTDPEFLKIWASEVSTSHVFEKALLSVKVSQEEKIKLIKAFRGSYCDLAKDKFGSHIIDKFWAVAGLGQKVGLVSTCLYL